MSERLQIRIDRKKRAVERMAVVGALFSRTCHLGRGGTDWLTTLVVRANTFPASFFPAPPPSPTQNVKLENLPAKTSS